MCNANSILTEHFAEHKFHSTYPKFQTDITSNSILQKGGNVQISPQNVRLRVFGFPQKRPVKHHVFLNLFGSGSGTLRVSKSQTCPVLSLLSRVFISGSRVFGFPQKRPVKHHVFLDLFRSGSGTLRVSKSQTCPAPSLLSRVFISGSRVLGNPVAHVNF